MIAALFGAAITASAVASAAQEPVGPLKIKPPDMMIPVGTKPGTLRRIIQPFATWTLICDENLKARKRICNVSQTLVDGSGATVFSWSLAASQGGAPILIVRLPEALAEDHFVQIVFGPHEATSAGVILSICDAKTCLGYLSVDNKIQRKIADQSDVAIKVRIGNSVKTFNASLDGLKLAVESLK